jgi:C1A family cysteine protease
MTDQTHTPIGNAKRRYDWQPDTPDKRDYVFADYPMLDHVPPLVDLRHGCSAVEDQGHLGACTGKAWTGEMEFIHRTQGVPDELSALFVYYNERWLEDTVADDSGAEIRTGAKAIAKWGVCRASLCPYVISRYARKPSAAAYTDGLLHTISSYWRIDTLEEMRACLAEGFPFVFGFSVYESFESHAVAQTGIVPMPGPHERMLGGHAVVAVGYSDYHQAFFVRNSWGKAWGINGYCMMPYAYLTDRDLSDDFWTVRK